MVDIATPLFTAFQRAADSVVDTIAKEGLKALKRTLDAAKFGESKYLKDFDVYAHVSGNEIEFEIVLDIQAVEPADDMTRRAMEDDEVAEEEILRQEAARTYGWHMRGPRRLRDTRKPIRDVRQSSHDARRRVQDTRKTSRHRLMKHEIALRNPRSADVTPEGKLSVSLKRTTRETERKGKTETRLPQGDFQGIVKQFMKQLQGVIARNFDAELQKIVTRYVGTT